MNDEMWKFHRAKAELEELWFTASNENQSVASRVGLQDALLQLSSLEIVGGRGRRTHDAESSDAGSEFASLYEELYSDDSEISGL